MAMPLLGMAFAGTTASAHTITIDTGPGSGGANSGPEPLELILLAQGTCTGMDVISILRKKRQTITGYTVNVYANQSKEHPKVFTEILVEHVVQGVEVNPDAVARSIELSTTKYCPVHAMLSKAVKIDHVFRILESAPGQV
jgi:putative redox protein